MAETFPNFSPYLQSWYSQAGQNEEYVHDDDGSDGDGDDDYNDHDDDVVICTKLLFTSRSKLGIQ